MKTRSQEQRLAGHGNGRLREFDRRQFLTTAASLGFVAVWLPLPSARRAAAAEGLSYFTWSGYELEDFHRPYLEQYQSSPDAVFFGNEDEALQKLRSGFASDLAHPCSSSIVRWRDAGVLQPIDVAHLSNWPDVWERLKAIENTVDEEGRRWFVPFDWGTSSIIYRTDKVELAEESWSLLFDEQYKGQLATFDGADVVVPTAALAKGYQNIYSLSDEQLAELKPLVEKQRELVRFYWTSQTEIEQALASGEIVAAYGWNSSFLSLHQDGVPVAYMSPKEGLTTWVCGLVRLKDAPGSEDAAYDFIDAMLAPDSGKALIEQYGYGHSNRKAFERVSQDRLVELGIESPETLLSRTIFQKAMAQEVEERYTSLYNEVKFGG